MNVMAAFTFYFWGIKKSFKKRSDHVGFYRCKNSNNEELILKMTKRINK